MSFNFENKIAKMKLFNWLTTDAKYKLNIDVGVYLSGIRCCFELYNAKVNINIPLPFANLNPFKVSNFLVYKTFIRGKEYAGVKRRTIELQVGKVSRNFGFGLGFSKWCEITDHDPTELSIHLGCVQLLVTSSHSWHVFNTDTGLRFPTEEEARKIEDFADVLRRKMFGGTLLPYFTQNKAEREKLDDYYKRLQEFEADTLHIIGKGTWNDLTDGAEVNVNETPVDENVLRFGFIRDNRLTLDLADILKPLFCLGKTRFRLTGNKPTTIFDLKHLVETDAGDLTEEDYVSLIEIFTLDANEYKVGSFYRACLQSSEMLDIYDKMVAAWFERIGETAEKDF